MRILVLGAGAIGSNLTNRLVADLKGEDEITVLDMDTVEERNVIAGTQFYMRDQIGMNKVEALQYNIYKFHEREIDIRNEKFEDKSFSDYDFAIDCFDNHSARKLTQDALHWTKWFKKRDVELLHIGFSDQFTFAIEWDGWHQENNNPRIHNYKVPDDIISGMDICTMEGASSFINYVSSIAGQVALKYIKDGKKIDIIGNKLSHTIVI